MTSVNVETLLVASVSVVLKLTLVVSDSMVEVKTVAAVVVTSVNVVSMVVEGKSPVVASLVVGARVVGPVSSLLVIIIYIKDTPRINRWL